MFNCYTKKLIHNSSVFEIRIVCRAGNGNISRFFYAILPQVMAKTQTTFFCKSCGATSAKWVGKCNSCGEWNTFVEEVIHKEKVEYKKTWKPQSTQSVLKPVLLSHVEQGAQSKYHVTDAELSRVLGGGLVPGSVVLIGGEPGIGKSTLMLQIALQFTDKKVLYISGEESDTQIKMRAERLPFRNNECYLFTETSTQKIGLALQELQPDIVVVAGDWTYEPENRLIQELSVLKEIQAPVYSVPGNHDEQYPGPPIQSLLKAALEQNNVMDIEGKIIDFDEFRLIGIGDLWAGKANMRFMPDLPQDKPWLILSHNPDTVDMVPELPVRPLMLAGHTHGGQIELPWITTYIMKKVSILGHKKGFYTHEHADVFVTVGTGMVGVPFRFRVPPTIDIIELI